jgi:drug/metabolite transporter (DMT)-like permease
LIVIVKNIFLSSMKKAFIQLHIAVFLAGFTGILGRLIELEAGMLVWYRMLITAVTLLLILYFTKQLQRLPLKNAFEIFGVGTIVAIHWVTFYASIKFSNVSVSLTCFSAIGFFTAFLDPLIMKRRIDIAEVFLGLLAIAGIYLIFDFYPEYELGILFGIISALLASLFPIINKNLLRRFSSQTVTLYEMGGGFIALTFMMPLFLNMFPAQYYFPTASDWVWLVVLAWLCTVFTFILALNALKKISPFTANLAYNLEPVYGIILAFIIFKENKDLSAGFYYGLGLILLAVILQMVRVVRKVKSDRKINMENKFLNT